MSDKKKFDWKATLATVAPGIATALGGPLAGIATQTLSNVLLGKHDGSEDEISAALMTGGMDALLKVKQAEHDFQVKLKELDVKVEEIYAQDRGSARELAKADMGPHKLISTLFIGGYFFCLCSIGLAAYHHVRLENEVMVIITTLIAVMTREMSGIMQFWFGTSSGSKEKTAALANSAPVPQ